MFCSNCGKEVFGESRFCSNCGTPTAVPSNPTAPATTPAPQTTTVVPPSKPKRTRRLWKLHTRKWEGICPSCGLSNTIETTPCQNDGSPLVVAFNAWLVNPLAYPLHTAYLCCLKNCGVRTNAIACSRCSTSIAHENLRFSMPLWRYLLHNALNLGSLILLVVLITPYAKAFIGSMIIEAKQAPNQAPVAAPPRDAVGFNLLVNLAAFLFPLAILYAVYHFIRELAGAWVFWRWWPFRYTYTFEQVERAAHKWRKLQAKGHVE